MKQKDVITYIKSLKPPAAKKLLMLLRDQAFPTEGALAFTPNDVFTFLSINGAKAYTAARVQSLLNFEQCPTLKHFLQKYSREQVSRMQGFKKETFEAICMLVEKHKINWDLIYVPLDPALVSDKAKREFLDAPIETQRISNQVFNALQKIKVTTLKEYIRYYQMHGNGEARGLGQGRVIALQDLLATKGITFDIDLKALYESN